jgi:hypothetical protein
MSEEKRNIHALIEKEAPSLNNLLDPNDVKEFKEMTDQSLEILGLKNKYLELKQK